MRARGGQAAGAPGEAKRLVRIEGGTHNETILDREYFFQIARFWSLYIKPLLDAAGLLAESL